MAGRTAACVTNPIAKSVLYAAGFGFPAIPEFLADLAERATGKPAMPVMMIAGPKLRVVPVTIHVPLAHVPPRLLTRDLIVETCRIVARDMVRMGIEVPTLAVAGLNPACGRRPDHGP